MSLNIKERNAAQEHIDRARKQLTRGLLGSVPISLLISFATAVKFWCYPPFFIVGFLLSMSVFYSRLRDLPTLIKRLSEYLEGHGSRPPLFYSPELSWNHPIVLTLTVSALLLLVGGYILPYPDWVITVKTFIVQFCLLK
jgi:hypothetical protein